MLDTLNRRLPTSTEELGVRVRPQPFDYYWWERLDWHGRLPTAFALAYALEFGLKSPKRVQDRLGLLARESNTPHGGKYLRRPAEQYPPPPALPSRRHHIVYDKTPYSTKALHEACRYSGISHEGWHDHQLMLACSTASIEIGIFKHREYTYIPRHRLIADRPLSAPITLNIKGKDYKNVLIPDQLFAIDYGGKQRWFLVETDRATETVESVNMYKKTIKRSLLQYLHFVASGEYKKHYNTNCGIVVLFITSTEARKKMIDQTILDVTNGKGTNFILTKYVPEFEGKSFPAPKPIPALWGTYDRINREAFDITKA